MGLPDKQAGISQRSPCNLIHVSRRGTNGQEVGDHQTGKRVVPLQVVHKKSCQRDGATVLRKWRVCPGVAAFSCVNGFREHRSTEMERRAQGWS